MGTTKLVNCQILLHLLRIIFLLPPLILISLIWLPPAIRNHHRYDSYFFSFWYVLQIIVYSWSCINDLYMLTWDAYTYGSFLATFIPQTFTSLSVVACIIFVIVEMGPWTPGDDPMLDSFVGCLFLSLLVNAIILVVHVYLWIKGSWSFNRGVKDMCDSSKPHNGTSVFGWKRNVYERRRIGMAIPRWFTGVIFRRIKDVETPTLAATRNIFAMLLLVILVAQSIILFRGVLYEKHLIKATLPIKGPVAVPNDLSVRAIFHELETPYWTPHISLGTSTNTSTHDIQSTTPCSTYDNFTFPNQERCNIPDGSLTYVVHITLTVNVNGTDPVSKPGGIWVSTETAESYPLGVARGIYPLYLTPGYQTFGIMEVTQWMFINPSLLEELGFSPTYWYGYSTSVDWTERTALDNTSIAQATLQFSSSQNPISQVEQEYRTHTFLNALTSIGGLLAVFQSIHLLFFGRPLFWGLFGSKLLDPFGIFGRLSNTLQSNMKKRYISEHSNALDLPLFLSEFVIEMGPLGSDTEVEGRNDSHEETKLLDSSQISIANSPPV